MPTSRWKRWLRFSLRTFLVFVTLVACVAAWIGAEVARRQRESSAIEQMVKRGNTSTYWASRFNPPPWEHLNPLNPTWPQTKTGIKNRLLELDMFQTVVLFSLHPSGNTFSFDQGDDGRLVIHRVYRNGLRDEDMQWLRGLANLRGLWLEANGITDEGMVQLSSLTQLESLWLQNTAVTDRGMSTLASFPALRDLDLSGTYITDGAVPAIAGCKRLRRLVVTNTNVTAEGIANLRRQLPKCQIENR